MGKQELGYRIHHWDLVVPIGRKVVLRVVELDALPAGWAQKGGEVSLEHLRGENAGLLQGLRRVSAHAFVIGKEEELVPQDGPAKGSAKDVLGVAGLRDYR